MSLTLHYHPIASFCWKVLVALYELELPFEKKVVDLGDPAERAAFVKLSPMCKMPALEDHARGAVVLETTILLEYLDHHYAAGKLLPSDFERALACRFSDRFYDSYVHGPMQRIVADRLRPADARDAFGVDEARAQLDAAYAHADEQIRGKTWALGDAFTLADCAAAPALYYADRVHPLAKHTDLAAYLERLRARPSFARVLAEAAPMMHMFPG